MRRFLLNILIFFVLILIIVIPIDVFNLNMLQKNLPGYEVYQALKLSKTKSTKQVRKLVIGDSTGNLLYPCEQSYDNIVSLACNQAITMAGHYFLLKHYLETNIENLPDEVILLISPYMYSNDLDIYAYQYFLKPFPIKVYKPLYTDHLWSRIRTIPLYWSANFPIIQNSGYTPSFAIPSNEGKKLSLSKLSYEYLLKMNTLVKLFNIRFNICATPMRLDKKEEIESIICDLRKIEDTELTPLLINYINSIEYYPNEQFTDETHLKAEAIPEDYLNIL